MKGRTNMTKTELLEALSTGSDLTKKQVGQVLDVLGEVIGAQLGKKGSGMFVLPGLLKITRVTKPARKAGKKPNPFKPGEMMEVKARAAHNVVKVRPLKKLKEMV
jgi:nucleoid DNA-binding protein